MIRAHPEFAEVMEGYGHAINSAIGYCNAACSGIYPGSLGELLFWGFGEPRGPIVNDNEIYDKIGKLLPVKSVANPCCETDGIGDYMDCGFSIPSGTEVLDVEYHGVRNDAGNRFVFSETSTNNQDNCFILAVLSAGTVQAAVYRGGVFRGGSTISTVAVGDEYSVRILADNTGTYVWLNGELEIQNTSTEAISTPGVHNVYVGMRSDGVSPYNGRHFEAKISINGDAYAHYNFTTNQGATELDISGNGRHGEWAGDIATIRTTDDDAPAHLLEQGFTPWTYFDGVDDIIDTLYMPDENIDFEAEIRLPAYPIADQWGFGSTGGAGKQMYFGDLSGTANRWQLRFGDMAYTSTVEIDDQWHKVAIKDKKFYLDDVVIMDATDATFTAPTTVSFLVGAVNTGSVALPANCKIKYWRINGTDMVRPSRTDPTKMVDLVTGTEYGNAGTGDLEQGYACGIGDGQTDALGGELYAPPAIHNGAPSLWEATDFGILGSVEVSGTGTSLDGNLPAKDFEQGIAAYGEGELFTSFNGDDDNISTGAKLPIGTQKIYAMFIGTWDGDTAITYPINDLGAIGERTFSLQVQPTGQISASVVRDGTTVNSTSGPTEVITPGENFVFEYLANSTGLYGYLNGKAVAINTSNTDPIDTPFIQDVNVGQYSSGGGNDWNGTCQRAYVECDDVPLLDMRPSQSDPTKMIDLVSGTEFATEGAGALTQGATDRLLWKTGAEWRAYALAEDETWTDTTNDTDFPSDGTGWSVGDQGSAAPTITYDSPFVDGTLGFSRLSWVDLLAHLSGVGYFFLKFFRGGPDNICLLGEALLYQDMTPEDYEKAIEYSQEETTTCGAGSAPFPS